MPRFDYRLADIDSAPPSTLRDFLASRPQLPYLLPFFAYLLVMLPAALGHVGGIDWADLWKTYLPVTYPLKTLFAAILLWLLWPFYTRIYWGKLTLGLLVGLLGTALWIASEYACQYMGIASPPSPKDIYNPDLMLHSQAALWTFLCLRVVGPSLVVPVMEELFFRDFVQRALIRGAHFQEVPIGTFTWPSLLGMAALFGINHGFNFFIPGFLYGLLMGILLIRTKSLGACIVAHGFTNFTLYLYVIYTGNWQFM